RLSLGGAPTWSLWVKCASNAVLLGCPIFPQKRTLVERVVMSASCQKRACRLLVLRGLGEVSVDRLFAQCLPCFEPMQTFYEDEAITIRPNQDGHLLSDFQHTLGDLLNNLWFERCAAFYRHVDVCDRKFFSPHHGA